MSDRQYATLAGRTCVVTGATSGIGRAAACALAGLGANVILVGRNARVGHDLLQRLRGRAPAAALEFMKADLSVQDDVRVLVEKINAGCPRVDVLINNAGARFDEYLETSDGIELTFATNHLGHYLLTNLLLGRLLEAPAGRIITVTSGSHFAASPTGPWSLFRRQYDRRLAYAKSKLANLMFAYELAERLGGTRVTSNAVDPGAVATNFARNNGWMAWARHLVAHAVRRELASSRRGAETLVYLAASGDVAGVTGRLFRRNRAVESSPASHDRDAAVRLWELSDQLTGLTTHVASSKPC